MNAHILESLPNFLSVLGIDEEPMGVFYTDERPIEGFSPETIDLPTREKELTNEIALFYPRREQGGDWRLGSFGKEILQNR